MATPSTNDSATAPLVSLSAVIGTGCLTLVLASLLAYAVLGRRNRQSADHGGDLSKNGAKSSTKNQNGKAKQHGIDNVDLTQYPGGSLTIYFATQTGTAESFAREIEREGPHKGFFVHVVDLEDVDISSTSTSTSSGSILNALAPRSLFLVSTYGEGEPPDHAVPFVHSLQAAAGLESLLVDDNGTDKENAANANANSTMLNENMENANKVEYAVFGLGNRQYDHYNAMGRFFDTALSAIGGTRLAPCGLGDDNVDLEADFEAWKDTVWWPHMLRRYLPQGGTALSENSRDTSKLVETKLPDCPLMVTYHDQSKNDALLPNYNLSPDQIHSSSRHYFTAVECPVTVVRELQTTHDGNTDSTVHVEIDIAAAKALSTTGNSGSGSSSSSSNGNHSAALLTYSTADNLGVLPVNDEAIVKQVAHALGYDLDAIFSVSAATATRSGVAEWHGAPFPMPCTVRECLTRYVDVTSAPRRSDLKLLASYCKDPVDRTALLRMAAKEGRAEYKDKILDNFTGLVDLLHKCPSLQMPLEHFINVCSPLQTRFFTIASSSSQHPTTIHLTVAVTQHVRPHDQSIFHGVCSTHLSKLGDVTRPQTVRVFNRPSSFRLPADSSRPILMVGPGTGIAPMRAFLQERAYQRDVLKQAVGTNILYFGCKRKSQDYIYQDELEGFVASGVLHHLRVAFSREQSEKVYVQHMLQQHAAETWSLLHESQAHVYVCGGVKMGQDVSEALREIISSQGNMPLVEAKEYLARLSQEGRFVQELWA